MESFNNAKRPQGLKRRSHSLVCAPALKAGVVTGVRISLSAPHDFVEGLTNSRHRRCLMARGSRFALAILMTMMLAGCVSAPTPEWGTGDGQMQVEIDDDQVEILLSLAPRHIQKH